MARYSFQYLIDAPIIVIKQWPQLEGNANGPSLIKIPHWVESPIAKYYLYFAHHQGRSIRIAHADDLNGPWSLNNQPALDLADSLFAVEPPDYDQLDERVRQDIENGTDGCYPHIASPDIIIDSNSRQIRLYYHGRLDNGLQATRVAISLDGLNFVARPEILGLPYFRVFKQGEYFYALAMPGVLYRSRDGLTNFEKGPTVTNQSIRHFALLRQGNNYDVFWTRVEDLPERILCSTLLTRQNWRDWKLGPETEVHRPLKHWKGAHQALMPSTYGAAGKPVNQLRDPAIYTENDDIYLLYATAGEQGIAIGRIIPAKQS